jgi:pilus assembly protein Flp/PilA
MSELLKKFMKEESGATMVEYAIMVALIAVAVAVTVALIQTEMNAVFQTVVECLADPNSTNCSLGN